MDNFWWYSTISAHVLFLWLVFRRGYANLIPIMTGMIICRLIETPIEHWAYATHQDRLHWNLFWGFGMFNLLALAAAFAETRKIMPAISWAAGIFLIPKAVEYIALVSCEDSTWPRLGANILRPFNLLCVLFWCYILRPRKESQHGSDSAHG